MPVLFLCVVPAAAATRTWLGGSSGNSWTAASNWSAPVVPKLGDTAVIDVANPAIVTTTDAIASTVKLGSLANKSGTLQIDSGGVLTTSTVTLGDVLAASGTASVTGGRWTNDNSFTIGNFGAGALEVSGAGRVTGVTSAIGSKAGSTGAVKVTGAGSQWTNSGQVVVGTAGSGRLTVEKGGTVSGTSAIIGSTATASGTVTVTGAGSNWTNSSFLTVGNSGQATLRVENGATLSSVGGSQRNAIGRLAGSAGDVTVTGAGSAWTAIGTIDVGASGTGKLTISDQASVGPGASTLYSQTTVGVLDGSRGTLLIESGGKLSASNGYIGGTSANASTERLSDGAATVTGRNSTWTLTGINGVNTPDATLSVGQTGKGRLDIADQGAVRLTAANSKVFVGFDSPSSGTLNITGGGTLSGGTAVIASRAGSSGTASVSGSGSRWDSTGQLTVGNSGTGTLQVTSGAALTSDGGSTGNIIGRNGGSNGTVTVSGSGSSWYAKGSIHTGYNGTGSLVVADGAQVSTTVNTPYGNNNVGLFAGSNGTLRIESGGSLSGGTGLVGGSTGATGTATVTGQGSRWINSSTLTVGSSGTGTLTVEKGGYITSDGGVTGNSIGRFGTSVGVVTVTDPGSMWSVIGSVHVGYEGKGTLVVSNGASVSAMGVAPYGNINVGLSNGSDGTLRVESGGTVSGLFGMIGGTVNASATTEGTSRGQATVTGLGTSWTVGDTLAVGQSGEGTLSISDQARVSAANAVNVGFGRVSKGTLLVDGGATLSGATATIGSSAGSTGAASVNGAGSSWTTTGALTIGSSGTGVLTLANQGGASAAGVTLAASGGAGGTLNIGAASGSAAQAAGALGASTLSFGAGNGTLVFNHTDSDYRFTTAMRGAGAIKLENGRTVFTGESSGFGGSTAISAGATLQLGDGGTQGSLGGPIADDGTLVFDRSDDIAMTGALAGTGKLIKQGDGTLLLGGDASGFTGSTTLATGGLRVDGSLAHSTVAAQGGTVLSGGGTVGGVVAQAGSTVTPGTGSLATLSVTGDYHQLSGSVYAVDVVQNSSRSDRISIGGAAMIDGGAILDITARGQGDYTVNDDFTVLTATGGVSGTYLLAGDTQISDFYRLAAVYDANNVYLRAMQVRSFADAALTPNQIATATGIESLPADSQLRDAVAALTSDTEARQAFDQLSGELHPSIAGAMVEDSRFIRDVVVGRLRCSSVERPETAGEDCRHGRVWSEAYGAQQNTNGDGNAAAFSDDVSGFVAGIDAALPAGWQAGILAGTAHSAYGAPARNATASSDSYTLGAYGGMAWRGLGLRLGAAYSRYSIDATRNLSFTGYFDTLDSSYAASTAQAFGDVGYTFDLGPASLEPFAALARVNVHSDGFDETGGDAALSAGDAETDVTFSSLGIRAAAGFTAAQLRWTASGSAAWRHGWGDLTPATTMGFDGSASFIIHGAPIAEDTAALEAGLAVGADEISFGIFYQGQFGDGFTAQGATGRLSFAF